jgi:outer membrane protein assembly factor BamE (lipoprotein component of BamABCDE complex)
MRSIRLAVVLMLALALPALARARAWKGINPGATTQAEVVEKFGEPTTRSKRGGRTILAYYGEQALEGTRQAQFHVDGQGVVVEITIFLTAQLDADTIVGTYGKPPQRTFVEDTFQKVWLYPQQGVTVYFNKEGNVEALTFAPGTKAAAKAAPASGQDAAPPAAR